MPNSQRSRSRCGYILLVVLGVLVLVVTVLGLLAKVSLRRGVQSVDAELALQQRWGAVSLQRVLLHDAPKIFEDKYYSLIFGLLGVNLAEVNFQN